MPEPSETPRRILICRTSAHGDVIQTLPLLHALKTANHTLEVGWLVESSAAPLLQNHPLITHLHVCPRKQWLTDLKNPLRWPAVLTGVLEFISQLKAARYNASLDVQGLLKSALWPWLAGIPQRYGNAHARENASLFYNHLLPEHKAEAHGRAGAHYKFDPGTPAIRRYLEFADALGHPAADIHFPLPDIADESRQKIATLLSTVDSDRPLIVLSPATIWPTKHWIPAHWQRLIEALLLDTNNTPVTLAVIAAPQEADAIREILNPIPSTPNLINLTGQTAIADLYALFERTDVFVGLDSAPLHIANAIADNFNKPRIVALFGPTAPGRTGPIGNQHRSLATSLDCQPCFERHCPLGTHACMTELSPEQALAAIRLQLAQCQPKAHLS